MSLNDAFLLLGVISMAASFYFLGFEKGQLALAEKMLRILNPENKAKDGGE